MTAKTQGGHVDSIEKLDDGLHVGRAVAALASEERLGAEPLGVFEMRGETRIVLHYSVDEKRQDEVGT